MLALGLTKSKFNRQDAATPSEQTRCSEDQALHPERLLAEEWHVRSNMASSGGKGHHHTQAPLPPCCNCCRGAAMQPCSAVSKRKKPLLFGMVAFKTYFSPHCISNMRKRTEVFSNHFSLNIFYQKQIKWQTLPHLKDPPLLLGLHPILKAFLYIWGEKKKKNQQKLVLLRFF